MQGGINFSVKEKDEARPSRLGGMEFAECLHSPFCRSLKVFVFGLPISGLIAENSGFALVSQSSTLSQQCGAIERSAVCTSLV